MDNCEEHSVEPVTPTSPGRKWFCTECNLLNDEGWSLCRNCLQDKPSRCPPSPKVPGSSKRRGIVEQVSGWVHEVHANPGTSRQITMDCASLVWGRQVSGRLRREKNDSGPSLSRCSNSDDTGISPSGKPCSFDEAPLSQQSTACPSEVPADPLPAVIVFDWDDTLFPTTELFDEWGLSYSDKAAPPLSEERELGLQKWRDAVGDYLHTACSLTECVAIVTSSRRPWVETCIERFVPSLKELFARKSGGPLVIYAEEALPNESRLSSQSMGLRPVRHRQWDLDLNQEEWEEEYTAAKYAAIKLVLTRYYSSSPGTSWNVLSLGDMRYERDATQEVTFKHCKEKCYTKTILVPTGPSLSEITLRLKFSRLMLPEYLHFEGDIDLDLQTAEDPLEAIGVALNMKELATLSISRHAWGRTKAPNDGEMKSALAEVAAALENLNVAQRAREAGVRWAVL